MKKDSAEGIFGFCELQARYKENFFFRKKTKFKLSKLLPPIINIFLFKDN